MSTNYSLSGAVVTFTANPALNAEIEVKHIGFRSVQRRSTGYILNTFTGNGSDTSFTLSDATTVNDAFVFTMVSDATNNDYGISGTTLTFTFTPLNSSNIMVRYQV